MPLSAAQEDLLNANVFGTTTTSSAISLQVTIVNTLAIQFVRANCHLHTEGTLEDLGDDGQYPSTENYAFIPVDAGFSFASLPKLGHTHGSLTDDQDRTYTIYSVDQDGSRLRLHLSSQLL